MATDGSPRAVLREGDELDISMQDDPAEARRVRRVVTDVLSSTDLGRDQYPDALLAISELVSNALVHGRPPRTVRLSLEPRGLLVEVFDGSPLAPCLVDSATSAPGGRGLQLVARLTSAWGTRPCADGKWVWCVVDLHRRPAGRRPAAP